MCTCFESSNGDVRGSDWVVDGMDCGEVDEALVRNLLHENVKKVLPPQLWSDLVKRWVEEEEGAAVRILLKGRRVWCQTLTLLPEFYY